MAEEQEAGDTESSTECSTEKSVVLSGIPIIISTSPVGLFVKAYHASDGKFVWK